MKRVIAGLALAAGLTTAIAATACTAAPARRPAHHHSAATPPAAAPAAAVPSPGGTYQGSCSYTLSTNPYGDDYLVGEIDLTNTGSVATTVHATITWPQEGYPPIKASRTVRTSAGQSMPVRFHISAGSSASNSNVISLLQAWQLGHNGQDGCTYHAVITSSG